MTRTKEDAVYAKSGFGLLVFFVWTIGSGCSRPTADDDTSPPPDLGTDSGSESPADCEGTPPIVEDVWCINSGIRAHYSTGEDTVTMQVWTAVSDDDGDLTEYTIEIFFDEEVDSTVDTENTQFNPVHGSVDYPDCQATRAELGLTLYLTGSDPEYETEYDWGAVVTDSYGLVSEPFVTSCWTPTMDGSDGGPDQSDTGS